jgi:hypothetical protein
MTTNNPKTKMRLKEDQNLWNFLFAVFFVVVLVAALIELNWMYEGFPNTVSLFDVILIILASFRITRLIVYDKVTRFFREWFVEKREVIIESKTYVEIIPYTSGFRATLHELLNCPWCIGMWAALITTFAYFAFDWSWFVILFLAIAGVASFIQILANLIGWKAENLKLEAAAREE